MTSIFEILLAGGVRHSNDFEVIAGLNPTQSNLPVKT